MEMGVTQSHIRVSINNDLVIKVGDFLSQVNHVKGNSGNIPGIVH